MSSEPQPAPLSRAEIAIRAWPAVTAAVLWVMAAPAHSAPTTWETYLAPLLTGALVAWVAAGLGERLIARFLPLSRGLALAYSIALGFGALSFAVMALALCRCLSDGSVAGLLCVAAVALPPRRSLTNLGGGLRDAFAHPQGSPGVALAFSLLLLMAISYLAIGLCPPFDTDSLRYHLRFPELYLQAHTFVYPERNHFAHFPLGAEMLYTIGLALGGPSGANLIAVVAGMACLLGIYSLAARRFSPPAGIAAAAVFATTPLVGCLFGATVTDLFVCLYVVLGVGAVWNGREEQGGPSLVLAGLCGGLAATTKLGGATAVALMAVWAAVAGPRNVGVGLRRLLTVAAPAALVVAPWVIKTWVVTGNPVFPFLPQLLDGRGWRPEWTAAYASEVRSYGHMGGGLLDYVLSPLWLTLRWQEYGTPAPLGPLYLALLVGLALLGRRGRPVWGMTAWCAGFFGLWLLTAQVARFVLPGLAVLSIVAGFVVAELGKGLSQGRPSIPVPTAAILLALAAWTWYWQWTAYQPYLFLTGRMTKDEYLGLHANYYPVAQYANRELPPGSRILFVGETLSYGLRVPALVETGFAGVTAVDLANRTRSPAELARAIRDLGFTHVLYNRNTSRQAWAKKLHYFAWRHDAARRRFEQMLVEADALNYWEGVCLYRVTPRQSGQAGTPVPRRPGGGPP